VQDTAPAPNSTVSDDASVFDYAGNPATLVSLPAFGNGPAQLPSFPNGLLYFYRPYLEAPHSADYNLTGAATLITWVRAVPCGAGFVSGLLDKYDPSNNTGCALWLRQTGGANPQAIPEVQLGTSTFTATAGFPADISSPIAPSLSSGTWYMLAVVIGGGNLSFYLNGQPAGSFPIPPGANPVNTQSVFIGKSRIHSSFCEFAMSGMVLFKQALAPGAIGAIHSLGPGGL